MDTVQLRDPLVVQFAERTGFRAASRRCEKMLIDAAQDDGRFSESELEDLLNAIVKTFAEGMDCDE
jgi:hypothetical protein